MDTKSSPNKTTGSPNASIPPVSSPDASGAQAKAASPTLTGSLKKTSSTVLGQPKSTSSSLRVSLANDQGRSSTLGQSTAPSAGQSLRPSYDQGRSSALGQSTAPSAGESLRPSYDPGRLSQILGKYTEPSVGQSLRPSIGQTQKLGQTLEQTTGQSQAQSEMQYPKPTEDQDEPRGSEEYQGDRPCGVCYGKEPDSDMNSVTYIPCVACESMPCMQARVPTPAAASMINITAPCMSLANIAQALEDVQAIMCSMDRKMGRTGRVVRRVVRRLNLQGHQVQQLQTRLSLVEPKCETPAGPLPPCDRYGRSVAVRARASHRLCPALPPAAPCAPHGTCPPSYVITHPKCSGRSCRPTAYVVRTTPSCVRPCPVPVKEPVCGLGRGTASLPFVGRGPCEPFCGDEGPHSDNCPSLGRLLFSAAHDGRIDDVLALLEAGADVNFHNSSRWTPLHKASAQAHACVVTILLEWGACVNFATIYGFTPLHLAAANDCSGKCVRTLIEAGADVNSWNRSGQVPLHLAADCDNLEAARELIRAGANTRVTDEDGRTPFDVARGATLRRMLHPCPRSYRRRSSRSRSRTRPSCANCAASSRCTCDACGTCSACGSGHCR